MVVSKFFKSSFLAFVLFFGLSSSVFRWSVPDDCYYVNCTTAEFGSGCYIYIPTNYGSYFSVDSTTGDLINTYSSSVNAYMTVGGRDYDVRFYPFDENKYRPYGGGPYVIEYEPLNITSIQDTNLNMISSVSLSPLSNSLNGLLILVFAGGILICLFMKR